MPNTMEGYLLSPMQKRAWDLRKKGHPYNNLLRIAIAGEIDESRLSGSLAAVVRRNEIFRTVYVPHEDFRFPVQQVREDAEPRLDAGNMAGLDSQEQTAKVGDLQEELLRRAFDPAATGSLGAYLVRLARTSHLLFLYSPTISSDGETLYHIAQELFVCYSQGEEALAVSEEPPSFLQYCAWQNELLAEPAGEAAAYWKRKGKENGVRTGLPFAGVPGGGGVSVEMPFAGMSRGAGVPVLLEMPPVVLSGGRSGKDPRLTPELILSCWIVLLWQHAGRCEAIACGITESGRAAEPFSRINGPMARAVPFHCACSDVRSFGELHQKVREERAAHLAFLDHLPPGEETEVQFECLAAGPSILAGENFRFTMGVVQSFSEPFKLKLCVIDHADRLRIALHYDPAFVTAPAAAFLLEQLAGLLRTALEDPGVPVAAMFRISEWEKKIILGSFNATDRVPEPASYISLFEQQVGKTPAHSAVCFGGQKLSYRELNDRADRFAGSLIREFGIGKGDIVVLRSKRSASAIAAILGILKAGAVFLPVDAAAPAEWLDFILQDSQASLLVTDDQPYTGTVAIRVTGSENGAMEGPDNAPVERRSVGPEDTAYIIYTSGSTGRPKGVLVGNASFTNYLNWVKSSFHIDEADGTVLFSSVAFDLSYTSLWSSLISGAAVHILEETTDPARLIELLRQEKISFLKLTPSHFSLLTDDPELEKNIANYSLRLILLGGEPIRTEDIEKYVRFGKTTMFVNHYGPTETTIGVVSCRIALPDLAVFKQWPVIGRPIDNNRIYIVDTAGELCPVGITGELCVAGAGLAKGYLNRPELTAERFREFPFYPGVTCYRTGDLGRWLPDGSIQLFGRIDNQVKIRGYRVETGEIEKVLLDAAPIRSAVVLADKDTDGSRCLKAFVVPADQSLRTGSLRALLAAKIPDYMMPSVFIFLEKLPLLPNGKTDKKALLSIKTTLMDNETYYEAPKTRTEETVAGIWKKVLLKDTVSTSDNFFNIGGNSLKIVKVYRELIKAFPYKFSLTELFKHNSIQAISVFLDGLEDAAVNVSDGTEKIASFDF